jgi:rubrerythrin
MQFESFDALVAWLTTKGRGAEMRSTLSALEDLVSSETEHLAKLSIARKEHTRKSEKLLRESEADAKSDILDELNEFLQSGEKPRALRPYDVLLYRRKAAVWAIATRIYEVHQHETTA